MSQIRSIDSEEFNGLKVAADWIIDLEASDSRLHKEAVIERALVASRLGSASAQCFLYNCYLAYNPFFVYNIKQVPETEGYENRANPWVEFWALLEGLRTRSISGNKAKAKIADLSERFDSEQWNGLCRRVILKDFRCGISEKTLNKVLKNSDFAIPVFECQLAQDSDDHSGKMTGRKRLEVKLDGVRVLALIDGSSVTLFSRNGKLLTNFPEVEEALIHIPVLRTLVGQRVVLDGEIVGASFQELMKQAHRKKDAKTTDMVYHIFDIIPFVEFQFGSWNAPQFKRTDLLESVREVVEREKSLRIMPGIEVDLGTAEGRDVMHRFADDAVAQGFEGIMIKNLEAPYECRRSSFWLKWKPVIEVSLAVVDTEEGTGRNKGRLGALICEGEDSGKQIRVNVGSGFSDANRKEYWDARSSLIGQIVEVRADTITQNQDGTHSLRFPRFVRFRGFDPDEKL